MRSHHRLYAVLYGGGRRVFVLTFLSSFPRPSATISHLPFVDVSPFFLFLLRLSSGVFVQSTLVLPALSSRSPLASFLPQQPHHFRFYGGAQLGFPPSQICTLSFLNSSDTLLQGLPHRSSYPSISSQPCSSHHAPPRGLHAPAHGSHAPVHASHAPPCQPRAATRSSSTFCPVLCYNRCSTNFFTVFFLLLLFSLYCCFSIFQFLFCCLFCFLWALISLP